MKNKKLVIICSTIVIAIVIAIFIFMTFIFNGNNSEYISYLQFSKYIENKEISKVIIGEKEVTFYLKNSDKSYYTNNPESDNFKEMLLLNDIQVEEQINYIIIFDVMFYLILFAVFGFAIFKLIQMRGATFKIIKHNDTKFSDIAGLDELKRDMFQTVDILKNPKKYEEKGIRAPTGIMLEGNPGNGKTLFARALAGEANINFIPTKATDFQSAMMLYNFYR